MSTRIRCKTVMVGPGPSEAIVAINRTDGREEELVVPLGMVENGTLAVDRIATENDTVLVELPMESASGNWRVWVNSSSIS
jgi:hypothetical protein